MISISLWTAVAVLAASYVVGYFRIVVPARARGEPASRRVGAWAIDSLFLGLRLAVEWDTARTTGTTFKGARMLAVYIPASYALGAVVQAERLAAVRDGTAAGIHALVAWLLSPATLGIVCAFRVFDSA